VTPFAFIRPDNIPQAVAAAGTGSAKYLAGGTNLIDLMREDIEHPECLVDISQLPLDRIEDLPDGALRLGATARNTDVANDARVRRRYPLLARAIVSGASPQVRNMATVAGNIMQRTRCLYFYDRAAACNKRKPGSGCDAVGGLNRTHAILGVSDHCIAVHPSDMCVALAALDALVQITGPDDSKRALPIVNFHRLPADTPEIDTLLRSTELITAIDLPIPSIGRSMYVKVRERASCAFALVSIAAVLAVEDGIITGARLALGGVAHKPWRCHAAEALLTGAAAEKAVFQRAAALTLETAHPRHQNAFKVELAKRLIVRTLMQLAEGGGDGP
jgi:xanthine dehydrogenase YagS FAD-binding subunit